MASDNKQTTTLTPSEFSHTIIAIIIGIGILGSTGPIEAAGNDGWLAVLIGGLYPLYMVWLATIISKRFPKDNIISINVKIFGQYLGSLFNLLLSFFFIYYIMTVLVSFTFVTRIFIASFIPSAVITILTMLAVFFLTIKGLKTIAKVNVFIFYLTFIIVILPGYALVKGSIINLLPVFNSGIGEIANGGLQALGRYTGIEVIFLIYPLISDKKKLKGSMLKGTIIVIAIYVWLTFIAIYYLGDVTIKFYWPILVIADSVQIPIINLFRYVFMLFWSLIIYRINGNLLYFSSMIIKDVTHVKEKYTYVIIGVIAALACFSIVFIYNETIKREIAKSEPAITLAVIAYFTIVTLLVVLLKKKEPPPDSNETSKG
ncbi:endospore germination permease [Vallitalea pronyensis]|uniref:Endospore germination permease n=1 Tax=Vallitalea pronyensis TaxID=1348613 RepID=A0A8J8MNF9_9FIRM|nr:endospore germination permease [Vallitalea pronyensis]QUI24443.1 endospore germination permease [Vallitalea pronyensis]